MSVPLTGSRTQKNSRLVEGLCSVTIVEDFSDNFTFVGWGAVEFYERRKTHGLHRLQLLLGMLPSGIGHELSLSSFIFLDQY